MMMKDAAAIETAQAIHAERYAAAAVTFFAGSLARGEGTATSDFDLVVVFEQLENARRESFSFDGWPVEAFVHDPATLRHFFGRDRDAGIPSLAIMVSEGIEIPSQSVFSQSLKGLADAALAAGPAPWAQPDVDASRYLLTNLVDDLRAPRSGAELTATTTALYGALATHYFRSRNLWSAKDKSIPRQLFRDDPDVATRFVAAFELLFGRAETRDVIALTEEILRPSGGWLFDGYVAAAPAAWRGA